MSTGKLIATLVALQFVAAPLMAQSASDKDSNAHHYQGGPKTDVPHMMKHPAAQASDAPKALAPTTNGHHYSGGPKSESHHMGDKK